MIPRSFKLGAEVIDVIECDSLNFSKGLGQHIKGGGEIKISTNALGGGYIKDSSKERTVACMKRNGLEILNFQHKMNYNRSTNFEYTTETIMFYTRC